MKKEEISYIIGEIDQRFIDEASEYNPKVSRKSRLIKYSSLAACCTLAVYLFMALPKSPAAPIAEAPPADDSPVYYSQLQLAEGFVSPQLGERSGNTAIDVLPFDEAMLSECCAIVEGRITKIYLKNYAFDTYDNKFEEGGIFHNKVTTVVYELEVEKSWYGDELSGQSLLVEDQLFFPDEVLGLKAGRRYVIPIYAAGESIYTPGSYASGDIARESGYSTLYPFHPQIELTEDGYYIVSSDWGSLAADGQELIMDSELGAEGSYYKDKMRLIAPEVFSSKLKLLIDTHLSE